MHTIWNGCSASSASLFAWNIALGTAHTHPLTGIRIDINGMWHIQNDKKIARETSAANDDNFQ